VIREAPPRLSGHIARLLTPGGSSSPHPTEFSASRTLSVALIPEPSTYAMMLAGLGLMGFVARREKLDKM